jgi:hypothetical protein
MARRNIKEAFKPKTANFLILAKETNFVFANILSLFKKHPNNPEQKLSLPNFSSESKLQRLDSTPLLTDAKTVNHYLIKTNLPKQKT